MSFTYLNAEQAIRVATAFRDAVAKESSGSTSYNLCTLFVTSADLDVVAERLGIPKKTLEPRNENEQTICVVEWNDNLGALVTFQARLCPIVKGQTV